MPYRKVRNWSCTLQNKSSIRNQLIAVRKSVTSIERRRAAEQACQHFLKSDVFLKAEHIACYFAHDHEFDCGPIMQSIWDAGKSLYLPVLLSKQENRLEFVRYRSLDPLRVNQFQIFEPDHTETFPVEKLDVVLMPLVGFDLQGHRLGMGGGFYDRTFEFMTNVSLEKKPVLVGVAFECQTVAELPHDPWDVPMVGVLTEERVYWF